MRAPAAALCALVLLAPACSDGSASAPTIPPTTPTTPTSTAPTTTPPTDPPTTPATTTTTEAPPTTLDEIAAIEEAIKASRLAGEEAYFAAASDPSNAQLRAPLSMFFTGDNLAGVIEFLDQIEREGQRVKANTEQPSSITFEGPVELPTGAASTEAFVISCRIDSDIVYDPAAGPDGADVIVNDDIRATRTEVRFVLEGGAWKSESGVLLGEWYGVLECPDA